MTFTYAECFAGAGGMSLGFERAGMTCRWHAEIADFPRRVLTHHWPDTPLYGDVAQIDGRELVARHGPITLLSGGAPCQDLSVAGKRLGFKGERSVLFFELVRLWDETQAPYFLYENVAGALSSNAGADFAAVLSAIVGGAVPVPADGWRGAGVVSGPAGVAAWRLLDAQWFGVPQRRLRVFVLGARAGGCDPAEVLLEPQGVRGHPPTRGEAGEGSARDAGTGAPVPLLEVGKRTGVSTSDPRAGSGIGEPGDPMFTLQASAQHGVMSFGWQNAAAQGDDASQGSDAPLRTGTTPAVLVEPIAWTEKKGEVKHFAPWSPSLMSGTGETGNMLPRVLAPEGRATSVTGEVTHALTHEGHDASEDGTGRGTPIVAGVAYFDKQRLGEYGEGGVASTLAARDYKDATDLIVGSLSAADGKTQMFGAQSVAAGHVQATAGIPRRLMPIECERLMSWPDGWTDIPDEKGKPASDAARYKACGNGVVSKVAEWIGERLVACHSAMLRQEAA